jgi:hypothetical protein
VVSNARLHHTPLGFAYFVLRRPTAPYCHPLCPTFVHIIGAFCTLSRGKRMSVQKKLSLCLCENMTKITATDSAFNVSRSLFLASLFQPGCLSNLGSDPRRWDSTALGLTDFPYSPIWESCYSPLRSLPRSRSTAHGMGYPSARRDRPELRNQLVRERRALVRRASPCKARFLERALCIPPNNDIVRSCTCQHAR